MLQKILILVLFFSILHAKEFTLASYNVENLFDLKKSGQEYPAYMPFKASGWNHKMFNKKIVHLKKMIKEIDADILALQEVENKAVLKHLNLMLGDLKYPYMYIPLNTKTVKNALLSKFPIKRTKAYNISNRFRDIHEVTVEIEKKPLSLYLNHWPSYKHKNIRIEYAKKLVKLVKNKKQFIILGDLNSPFQKRENGWGIANSLLMNIGYNLWMEQPYRRRYSHSFFGKKSALDHIVISKDFLKKGAIKYIPHSFKQVAPSFALDKKANPIRWKISKKGKGKHLGKGYSDHLPIYAKFTTDVIEDKNLKKVNIKELYTYDNKRGDYLLESVMVIDKKYYGVMLEDTNQDKIFFYRPPESFEIGKVYNLHVKEVGEYKGKKEIIAGVIID